MKLLKVAALVFVMCIMTTGCDTSSDLPENLLDDNIVYDKENSQLYSFINKSLEGTTLVLPGNSSEVGQINEVDSNIIAFQKRQDVNLKINNVGFVLISKNDEHYTMEDNYLEEGEEIEYANFYDLNNDGQDEVILLINNKSVTTMNIYSIENNKIKRISKVEPSWLKDYKKYTQMKIKVGFIDNDLKLDILMMNYDNSNGEMYVTMLNYLNNNELSITNELKIPNVKNLNDLHLVIGRVFNNKKGVVLSIPTLKENGYATQILFMKDNKLKKAFNDDKLILNNYYVPVKDDNSDGVIDIPVLNNNMIESFASNSKPSALISWRKWNNKTGKDADTIFISQVYYNYKYNFKFLVPDNLANKLYIQRNMVGDMPYYIFYYYDKSSKEPLELFQIGISPKNLVEDTKGAPKMETILDETDNNYYQLIVKNKDVFEKNDLTLENMKEYFSLIYK